MNARERIRQLFGLRAAFRRTFNGPSGKPHEDGKIVLAELARFCHAHRPTLKVSPTTGMVDPLAMASAEGRREVFNRIVGMLNLDDSDLHMMQKRIEEGQADG